MNFQKITCILIISFVASFFIRIIGTLFPIIFQNLYVVKTAIISHTFLVFVQLLFFIYFFSSYAKNRESSLKFVGFLAIIGSFAVFLIYINDVGLVFDIDILPLFLPNKYLDASIPLISSILFLLFFATYRIVLTNDEQIKLTRPILSATIGISTFFVLHLIVVINLTGYQIFNRFEHMPQLVAVCTLPFIVLAAILILYFYISFYHFLSWLNKNDG